MQKKRYAALTMVRDENFFLPIWHRYYAEQFDAENLFIIDHNSQEHPAKQLLPPSANIMCVPFDTPSNDKNGENRTSFDHHRFGAISKFIQSLLTYYDCVIFNDTDELYVVDDPMGLRSYLDTLTDIGVRAGVGIELFQHADETSLDPMRPILEQREHFYYRWNLCKPSIVSEPVRIGAHGALAPINLDPNLILLHLRFADQKHLQARQLRRLDAFEQNRGGQSSRWKQSLVQTQETVDQFWQRDAADLELPHRELLAEILPDYTQKKLCDENYPRFGAEPRPVIRPHEFFDPEPIKLIDKFRFVLPKRFKTYPS